jgi:leader peptidase (prepilin peptidase)/N-methyltransferase
MDTGMLFAVTGAVLCGAAGLGVPVLIARVPEPEEPAADKEPYAAIAATPRLALWSGLASAVAGGLVGWILATQAAALIVWWPLVPVGVALAVIDWRTRLLPTWIIGPTYLFVLVALAVAWVVDRDTGAVVRALLSWLVVGGIFWLLWRIHPRGMGYGDVRLSGVLALALGYVGGAELLVGMYAGFLLGALIGGVLAVAKIFDRKAYPFGPFMLVGALLGVVAGPAILGLVAG